jgi:hypothetical protein
VEWAAVGLIPSSKKRQLCLILKQDKIMRKKIRNKFLERPATPVLKFL